MIGVQRSDPAWIGYSKLKAYVMEECDRLFEPIYEQLNHFIFKEGCCEGQFYYYLTYGFKEAMHTPTEYIERLFDYSEEGKHLNYILSYYNSKCQVNIITEIGFGMGTLKRANHRRGLKDQVQGVPYMLKVGHEWTSRIPYENPGDFVSFSWFKMNVICPDQPWICGNRHSSSSKRSWWQRFFRRGRNQPLLARYHLASLTEAAAITTPPTTTKTTGV